MRIAFSDFRKGIAKLQVENLDDLWYVHQILEPGDRVKGKTMRKIKLGEGEGRNVKIVKKPVFLALDVEKVEFEEQGSHLRILGTVLEGPEEVPRGSHHTLTLEEGTSFTIEKAHWLQYQIARLKEAAKEKGSKVLLVVMDREEAYFAHLKRQGYQILSSLKGEVQKKADIKSEGKDFYGHIIKTLQGYAERYAVHHIVLASPAFWNEELMKQLKDETLRKKIVIATCSSADPTAFNEVLKRPEVRQVLQEEQSAREVQLVEELFAEIGKDGKAAYGFKEVERVVSVGAVQLLLVTDGYLQKQRQQGQFKSLEQVMKLAEQMKGEVHLIHSEHDGGKKLDGLGGIGAVLRYKIS